MNRIPASFRLSIILALLTVSLVIVGDFTGVVPDVDRSAIEARGKLVESLAVQYSILAQRDDREGIEQSMEALVDRNADVISAALRTPDGSLIAQAGNPSSAFGESNKTSRSSTVTNIRVPIFRDDDLWATVAIDFTRLHVGGFLRVIDHPLLRLVAFFAVAGFFSYLLFLRRALRDLDPSSVIPDRVKAAMDALAEGVLILDERERVVLANHAFGKKSGRPVDSFLGMEASRLPLSAPGDGETAQLMPWAGVLSDGRHRTGASLEMTSSTGEVLAFGVNSAPIIDPRGAIRGVLVTFDDVTELQRKNVELEDALRVLEASQERVQQQNAELEFLASHDPLTGCLNRRAFVDRFSGFLAKSRADGTELTCVILDIDHFKLINDRYGHGVGDQVIRLVGETLTGAMRPQDLVCRYGGEEFCIVMPDIEAQEGRAICERVKEALPERARETGVLPASSRLTASFGLSNLSFGGTTVQEILDQADQALYATKDRGRNRVMSWGDGSARHAPEEKGVPTEGAHGPADECQQDRQADTSHSGHDPSEESLDILERELGADPPSGLPKHAAFLRQVRHAARGVAENGGFAAVLIIGLRAFRRFGDASGDARSDELLRQIGVRLTDVLRASDVVAPLSEDGANAAVARCGVDEFGILLTGVDTPESVAATVRRLMNALSLPFECDGLEVNISCNIGISTCPLDGTDADELVNRAESALRHSDRHGEMGYLFYVDEMQDQSLEERRLASQLRHALIRGELRLSYQPIVEPTKGRIVAMEALVRWEHPKLGLLQPNQFLAVAGRAGLIDTIGGWALRTACEQARSWLDTGSPPIRINVNVWAAQLCGESFASDLAEMLNKTGILPSSLMLEVGESGVTANLHALSRSLSSLRALGVGLAIDELGLKCPDVDYVRRLAVDAIKIDSVPEEDLAHGSETLHRLEQVLDIAHGMGLEVIARRVETPEQLNALRSLGCDAVQGYLISPPVSPSRASRLLNAPRALLGRPGVSNEDTVHTRQAG